MKLDGEGETKTVIKTRKRRKCDGCGSPATYKHTYLNDGTTSDYDQYLCDDCDRKDYESGIPAEYKWRARFKATRSPHLFLYWHEQELPKSDEREMHEAVTGGGSPT